MSVRAVCLACGRKVKAADSAAGQTFDCPSCGRPIELPPATSAGGAPEGRQRTQQPSRQGDNGKRSAPVRSGASKSAGWLLLLPDGRQFGPYTKAQLQAYVVAGRVTARCQIWQPEWPEWRWAEDVFPVLKR